ncbi:FAD-dependent oxidoreductase [Thermopolyspora sp. NPDC052614]|uniref:NAD(P)/FAD-dependent oxidoreductase n=1 Tax=Thermopolyspora sp. NPDC052614 TaxID=3155682 RepID=UPI00344090B5
MTFSALVTFPVDGPTRALLTDDGTADRQGGAVDYRPELDGSEPSRFARALGAAGPDALIVREPPDAEAIAAWRAAAPGRPLVLVVAPRAADRLASNGAERQPADRQPAERQLAESGIECAVHDDPEAEDWSALALAERLWSTRRTAEARPVPGGPGDGPSVLMVGAGIVNLVTALALVHAGRRVTILDARPDPRVPHPWTAYGCTVGGGNARMFTYTEADGYHLGDRLDGGRLRRPVSQGGWRLGDFSRPAPDEVDWLRDWEQTPSWLATCLAEDNYRVNRMAEHGWRLLMAAESGLFARAGLRDGIVRLYSDEDRLAWDIRRHRRLGALVGVLGPEQVKDAQPALAGGDAIVGALAVKGFTVRIHDLVRGLLDLLERAGARLRWRVPVRRIEWDDERRVAGLVDGRGLLHEADHYVLSPGAYAGDLLAGLHCHRRIHGMVGVWHTIPDPRRRLTRSLKISRTGHVAADANATVSTGRRGEPVIVIGSGYGWTGHDPDNILPDELESLYRAAEDTSRAFFPQAYDEGGVGPTRKLCVRPWTASNLGIFETAPARGGGLLIATGGHNTGGFAQAPAVADAVLAALRGEDHPVHALCDPLRLSRLLGTA